MYQCDFDTSSSIEISSISNDGILAVIGLFAKPVVIVDNNSVDYNIIFTDNKTMRI